jgi:hypothetical protein
MRAACNVAHGLGRTTDARWPVGSRRPYRWPPGVAQTVAVIPGGDHMLKRLIVMVAMAAALVACSGSTTGSSPGTESIAPIDSGAPSVESVEPSESASPS